MEPGYLDIASAAQWSSVSTRTLERWIARGLPVYRATRNGKRLPRTNDIETFMIKQAGRVNLSQLVDEISVSLLSNDKPRTPSCFKP